MSKSEKKKKNQFIPGSAPVSEGKEELPERYADEEGVETTNILSPQGVGGSLESSTNEVAEDYIFKGVTPGKAFLHPPKRLIEGRVVYRAKFYGHMNVQNPRGTAIVRDAIDKLKTVAEVFRANNPGQDIRIVDLSISIRGVTCIERDRKEVLHQHPIHAISFSADDKRGKLGNMVAYIAKGRPPMRENICYVYEVKPKQAKEVITTIGQAFELAYRKYLDAKKAREGFEQLKQVYRTASEAEKERIKAQLEAERKRLAKEMLVEREKTRKLQVDPKYRPSHSNSAPVAVPEDTSEPVITGNPELMAAVQRKASEMELESKLKAQQKANPPKLERKESSIVSKWENISQAMELFQVEPSLDPDTQYLVPRMQTSELDDAISDLNAQIEDMEENFAWRTKEGEGPLSKDVDTTPFSHPLLDSIDEKLKEIVKATDDLEVPDLPANYVMDEFIKAREKANLPKEGTVKGVAGDWYATHDDMPPEEVIQSYAKAREEAEAKPKRGTVKNVAGGWYVAHGDLPPEEVIQSYAKAREEAEAKAEQGTVKNVAGTWYSEHRD